MAFQLYFGLDELTIVYIEDTIAIHRVTCWMDYDRVFIVGGRAEQCMSAVNDCTEWVINDITIKTCE
jgi:hypothetical protein